MVWSKVFMCKMTNGHFKKRFFVWKMTLRNPFRWMLNRFSKPKGGRGRENYPFLILLYIIYFFGFHEIFKNQEYQGPLWTHVLHHSIVSDYYISIILHHTVASAYYWLLYYWLFWLNLRAPMEHLSSHLSWVPDY